MVLAAMEDGSVRGSVDVEGKRSIEKDVEGNKRVDGMERGEVVDADDGHHSRLSVIEDENQRYSRSDVDVDVGLFPAPPVHLPFAPPPTPMSPSLVSSSTRVSEETHDNGEGGDHGVSSSVGGRRGMTSRWSLASSVEGVDGLGVGEGKRSAKEKEKEKRKSFVAFVAAVAGGGAPSNAEGVAGGGVGAGGLDVPTAASGENSKSDAVSSKDPKEKKRGRLASFISRLSYSGGANGLVSPGMFFFFFFSIIRFFVFLPFFFSCEQYQKPLHPSHQCQPQPHRRRLRPLHKVQASRRRCR